MNFERWERQLRFVLKADELKRCTCQKKTGNFAERSWHLTLIALLTSEYASDINLNLFQVLKMLIVHDLVRIGAGREKTVIDEEYSESDNANYLFTILPEDQHLELFQLWKEYEEMKTPEAKYAKAVARMQSLLYFAQNTIKLNQEFLKKSLLGITSYSEILSDGCGKEKQEYGGDVNITVLKKNS